MSEEALSFTFQLRGKPLEVHVGGDVELVSEIEFTAPTSRNMRESSQLKQALTRAMGENAEKAQAMGGDTGGGKDAAADVTITGEDIMQALAISSVPLEDVMETGFKLLVSGVGKVAGQKFSSTIAQQLGVDELERMVGEYAVNFPLKSLLS